MNRIVATLIMTAFLVSTFAGCIGSGGFGGGAPRAVVNVQQVGEDTYRFDGSGSVGKGLSFDWDFGHGTFDTRPIVEHIFEYDGTYKIRLVVLDSEGTMDVWEDEIVVGSGKNQPPVALFQVDARNYEVDHPVRVDASDSIDPDGAPLRYKWDFNFFMDFDEYEDFRAAKKEALENSDGGDEDFDVEGGGYSNDLPQSEPGLRDTVEEIDPTGLFGKKHPDHPRPDDDIERSIFSHEAETEQPVYVMEEGYPDTTTFFIKLEVADMAGGFEEIISEEVWAVEVYSQGSLPPKTARGGTNGTFDFGIPTPAQDVHDDYIPDHGLYTYQTNEPWTFELDWPVAPALQDGTAYTPGGWLNLSWEAESDAINPSVLEMTVTSPGGKTMSCHTPENRNGVCRVELDGREDYMGDSADKEWNVHIVARSGVDITWELEYWAKLDTNRFVDLE